MGQYTADGSCDLCHGTGRYYIAGSGYGAPIDCHLCRERRLKREENIVTTGEHIKAAMDRAQHHQIIATRKLRIRE
jgi:hypothetical protein